MSATKHSDITLFARIADGDERAFYIFYSEYRPQLHSFAIKLTRSAADADDVLQETFMRVWLNRDKLTGIENPRSWIFTINARVCLEYIRRKLSQQKKDNLSVLTAVKPDTPFDLANVAEVAEVIRSCVNSMPEQRRRIFQMSRDEGRKPAEIAELLGLSGGTVRNVLVTALKEIREALQEAGYPLTTFFFLLIHFF